MSDQPPPPTTDPSAEQPHKGNAARTAILGVGGGAVLFVLGAIAFDTELIHHGDKAGKQAAKTDAVSFQPPPMSAIPNGPEGESIRRGMAIFTNTGTNARRFVGNGLSCQNCHLDAGRKPDSAPMWAAWVTYPLYRSKNKQINTMEARIKGCFTYSMNAQDSPAGKAPPLGDQIYTDLQTYFHWLAKGAPTDTKLKGAGFFKLKETKLGYDPARGAQVFQQNCASCHGADGQGQRDINGRVVFPPLWGPHSYNWGAGMASVKNAAAFVKKNMPLGQTDRLTDQQAWDVAAFVDSQERPKDPRQTGSIADAAKQFHSKKDYYGKTVNGHVLGTGTPNSGPLG